MNRGNLQAGASKIVLLAIVAIALAAGYVAIYMYSGNEKEMLQVETRGMRMISALSSYRRASGEYPETLEKLVPKYVLEVSKCPGGAPMDYVASTGEYNLSCPKVVFKYKPYSYDSRSKRWSG